MSKQSGKWGRSTWGDDAWGVSASTIAFACDVGRAAAHAGYASPCSRSYPGLDRAKVFLNGAEISGNVFSFTVRLSATGSVNSAQITLYKGSLPMSSGNSVLTITYDGAILFEGVVVTIPSEVNVAENTIFAESPDAILAILPCPDLPSDYNCTVLIQQAAGRAGFNVEFGPFQDYFLGIYRTVDQEMKTAYLRPGASEGAFIGNVSPFYPAEFKDAKATVQATVWEAHHFSSLRQAIDTLSNSLVKSNVFHVPGTRTLRITNWNQVRSSVGTVPQGAMLSLSECDTTQGRINHLVLSCRDGQTIEVDDAADIAAHGLCRANMSTQVGTSGSSWAKTMALSVIAESKAPRYQWSTVLDPHVMPTDGIAIWTPDGEKLVKVESVEHTLSMDAEGAASRWSGKVIA